MSQGDFKKFFLHFAHIYNKNNVLNRLLPSENLTQSLGRESASRDIRDINLFAKVAEGERQHAGSKQKNVMALSSSSDFDISDDSEQSSGDYGVVYGNYQPYANEPLARRNPDDEERGRRRRNEVEDPDGLTPEVIAARYEREVSVRDWCQCGKCDVEKLVGSLEYRCCREVVHTSGKMVFDGSIEHINCITEHEDYSALTNTTVLRQAGPLLRRKDGGYYRKKKNTSENEYVP